MVSSVRPSLPNGPAGLEITSSNPSLVTFKVSCRAIYQASPRICRVEHSRLTRFLRVRWCVIFRPGMALRERRAIAPFCVVGFDFPPPVPLSPLPRHSFTPRKQRGHSPLATSLSYTRRIKLAQGFIHDLSRSIRSGRETGPQRPQRRNRRQTQEIPLAVGNQLLPAAAGCRSWRDAIPLGS